jgi:putative DNA primase/helicase
MHFYFRNTNLKTRKVKIKTPIGVTIDVGLGSKNAVVPLRIGDKTRRWLSKGDEVDLLPDWLRPVKHVPDFARMGEGDGRNQGLFNYILSLQSEGLSRESIREILSLINKYILTNRSCQTNLLIITLILRIFSNTFLLISVLESRKLFLNLKK